MAYRKYNNKYNKNYKSNYGNNYRNSYSNNYRKNSTNSSIDKLNNYIDLSEQMGIPVDDSIKNTANQIAEYQKLKNQIDLISKLLSL